MEIELFQKMAVFDQIYSEKLKAKKKRIIQYKLVIFYLFIIKSN